MKRWHYLCAAACLWAWTANGEVIQGNAEALYDVSLSAGGFTGTATSKPFEMIDDGNRIKISFPIEEMDTSIRRRNRDMQRMFSADEFPYVVGTVSREKFVEVLVNTEESVEELPLLVTMHGVTHPVTGLVSDIQREDSCGSFQLAFELSLSAFDIKAPRVMLFFTVQDIVEVNATMHVEAQD